MSPTERYVIRERIESDWAAKYPPHNLARSNWETSESITRFLDYATTRGVELCARHAHVEACYKATGTTVVLAGVVCGVSGASLICGLREGVYYPVLDQMQEISARYFGIDLAAFDREEEEMGRNRGQCDYCKSHPAPHDRCAVVWCQCPCHPRLGAK